MAPASVVTWNFAGFLADCFYCPPSPRSETGLKAEPAKLIAKDEIADRDEL